MELLLLLGCIVVAGAVTRHKWLNEPAKRREVLALQKALAEHELRLQQLEQERRMRRAA